MVAATRTDPILKRYRRYAPKYDRDWGLYSDRTLAVAEDLVEAYGGGEGDESIRLLDVACGTGSFAERPRRRHPQMDLVGVDLSPDMLRQAEARFNGDPHVRWIEASAEALPVESAAFDIVTCNNAFHLVPDQARALAEFRRVLKPGGHLVIIDWNREVPTIKLVDFNYAVFGRHPRTITTTRELREKVAQGGFEIQDIRRFKATWFWRLGAVVGRKPSTGRHA